MNRFIEFEQQEKTLPPIIGYAAYPLVSLNEALKPFIFKINGLQRLIDDAYRHCQYPSQHNLTRDEAAALLLYTVEAGEYSFYRILNQVLRGADRRKVVPWFPLLRLFDSALSKLPTIRGCVWRGVSCDISQLYKKNETVTWWYVSSCSSSVKVVQEFLQENDKSTLFMIEVVGGKDLTGYTVFPTEEEVILSMGTRLRVKDNALRYGKLHLIHLIEIDSQEQVTEAVGAMALSPKPTVKSIPPNPARWQTKGVTVAGRSGGGHYTFQLDGPHGLFVDEYQTVYVADLRNHRIMGWKAGATAGEVLAGGKGAGDRLDQLYYPTDVIMVRETDSFLICDRENRRVMRWPRHPSSQRRPEIVIDNIDCWGLFMGDQGSLYVSDIEKDEVRRYDKNGDKKGTVVAGGQGKGANLNQLNWPTYLFVDAQSTLYVSDLSNHRVMQWMKGAKEGIVVAGGNGQGGDLTQLSSPTGVCVDGCGHVYVVEYGNHRVTRWEKGAKQGTLIVGGNAEGEQANQLSRPQGLFFDRHGQLYVADTLNHRVQRFSAC